MATDQGKTSNMAGLSIMAELTGQAIPSVGTTVFRPEAFPVGKLDVRGRHVVLEIDERLALRPRHPPQGLVCVALGVGSERLGRPRGKSADVELAHREGFRAVEHLKRYTTLGMATDQGKTSNMARGGLPGSPCRDGGRRTRRWRLA
jgi:hypothetical protein